MKLGADSRKLAILAALVVIAIVVLYFNVFSADDNRPPSVRAPVASVPVAPPPAPSSEPVRPAERATRSRGGEFRPTLKQRRPEDRPDPMSIDPTLRLELLAKVQAVELSGGMRSLFDFAAAPPKTIEPKIVPKPVQLVKLGPVPPPPPPGSVKPPEIVKPPPPPITLKFYGYVNSPRGGAKRAFFLDGEDIVVAGEGELIRRRYKVVRIGVNSVEVEDTQFQHKQTLALEEQAG